MKGQAVRTHIKGLGPVLFDTSRLARFLGLVHGWTRFVLIWTSFVLLVLEGFFGNWRTDGRSQLPVAAKLAVQCDYHRPRSRVPDRVGIGSNLIRTLLQRIRDLDTLEVGEERGGRMKREVLVHLSNRSMTFWISSASSALYRLLTGGLLSFAWLR